MVSGHQGLVSGLSVFLGGVEGGRFVMDCRSPAGAWRTER